MLNQHILKFKQMKEGGFTLVEVITALSMVMIGISGAYAFINQSISASNEGSMKLTAAYLGKEGIEIVKNIRDSNYLKIYNGEAGFDQDDSWKNGLSCAVGICPQAVDCSMGCAADYTSDSLSTAHVYDKFARNSEGFYLYSGTGQATSYTRMITIKERALDPDVLDVVVKVGWMENGRSHDLTVAESLYNWW